MLVSAHPARSPLSWSFLVGSALCLLLGQACGDEPAARPVKVRRQVPVSSEARGGERLGEVRPDQIYVRARESGDMVQIFWSDKLGWVPKAALTDAPARQKTALVAVRDALRVRAGPGTNQAIKGRLPGRWIVAPRQTQGQWQKIDFAGGTGWVHARYLVASSDAGAASREGERGRGNDETGQPATGQPGSGAGEQPSTGGRQNAPVRATGSEREILARIVKGECPASHPMAGKIAVAAVVLNRVKRPGWPNTIAGVAHQRNQFSCYNPNLRNRLYWGPIPAWAFQAADAALAGQDPSNGADHYRNVQYSSRASDRWARGMTIVARHGQPPQQHVFYRRR